MTIRSTVSTIVFVAATATAGLSAPAQAAPAELARIEEFASRFPGWAELLAARQGQVARLTRTVEQLSERMAQDPLLAASLHEVLSAITAVRSPSAILAETEDIDPAWRSRFHRNIHQDSLRLTEAASGLVAWLDQSRAPEAGLATPQEEMEAWLAARGWHLPELEGPSPQLADRLIDGAPELASGAARILARAHLDRAAADASALPFTRLRAAIETAGRSRAHGNHPFGAVLVDFDGDGHVDLAASTADAIGSVANFLASHGWETGSPIAAPASVAGDRFGELIDAGILPRLIPAEMAAFGVRAAADAPQRPCALIDLATPNETTEYWLGYRNFYVITRYNRSSFYAMTVYALSQALKAEREARLAAR